MYALFLVRFSSFSNLIDSVFDSNLLMNIRLQGPRFLVTSFDLNYDLAVFWLDPPNCHDTICHCSWTPKCKRNPCSHSLYGPPDSSGCANRTAPHPDIQLVLYSRRRGTKLVTFDLKPWTIQARSIMVNFTLFGTSDPWNDPSIFVAVTNSL